MKIKLLLLIGLVALSASLVQSTSTVDADALTKSSRIQELHNGREGIESQDRILTHSSMRSLLEEHGGGFNWGNWGTGGWGGSSKTHGQRCQCTTTVINNNNNNNNNNGRRLLESGGPWGYWDANQNKCVCQVVVNNNNNNNNGGK